MRIFRRFFTLKIRQHLRTAGSESALKSVSPNLKRFALLVFERAATNHYEIHKRPNSKSAKREYLGYSGSYLSDIEPMNPNAAQKPAQKTSRKPALRGCVPIAIRIRTRQSLLPASALRANLRISVDLLSAILTLDCFHTIPPSNPAMPEKQRIRWIIRYYYTTTQRNVNPIQSNRRYRTIQQAFSAGISTLQSKADESKAFAFNEIANSRIQNIVTVRCENLRIFGLYPFRRSEKASGFGLGYHLYVII